MKNAGPFPSAECMVRTIFAFSIMPLRLLLLLFILPGLFSCAAPVAVLREVKAVFVPPQDAGLEVESAAESLREARLAERRDPLLALETSLGAVEAAARTLQANPRDEGAVRLYNFALGRVFGLIRTHNLKPWDRPFTAGRYTLVTRRMPRGGWDARYYEFIPDDNLEVSGAYLTRRVTREGLGARLVAIGGDPRIDYRKNFAIGPKTYHGVTAVARFVSGRCEIDFHDPLDTETVNLFGRTFPLAADYTTPLAVLLTRERLNDYGMARLLNPDKYAKTARLSRLRPYDPERIPVLLVHGLRDTPATWIPMVNALNADPAIRKNYQIWIYSYPSGYPYPYSAALLRRELDKVEQAWPDHKPIVFVGHSMGGMLGRLLLTDSGDKIWHTYFRESPEQLDIKPEDRQLMTDMFIFRPQPEISRAVFICTPHRGADLAAGWIGRLFSKIIKAPATIVEAGSAVRQYLSLDEAGQAYARLPNSIESLSPRNYFVKTVNKLPLTPAVPWHSIIGDRGRGDTPDSSDSYVSYWSSHLPGAQSEKIIPSNHSGHQHPEGIAEVRRILLMHLDSVR